MRKKYLFFLVIIFSALGFLVLQNISVTRPFIHADTQGDTQQFDPNKHVLVFLHIQKTGGSDFDRAIVKHLLLRRNQKFVRACEKTPMFNFIETKQRRSTKAQKFKKYQCVRGNNSGSPFDNWYFSRQTFGWVCGLHPDMADLKNCVHGYYPNLEERDFFYFTILRNPFQRYISEWKHVSRGATWIRQHAAKNCLITSYELCFGGRANWENATLDEFMSCEHNLASNRQTRMLATYDSHLSRCDRNGFVHLDANGRELVRRAKRTLKEMPFFAINEYQHLSQLLFEKTFGGVFKFQVDLDQSNRSFAHEFIKDFRNQNVIRRIETLNSLDFELYSFAVKLFFQRLDFYNIKY